MLGRVFVALGQIAILVAAGRFLFRLDFGRSAAGLAALLFALRLRGRRDLDVPGRDLRQPGAGVHVGWLASMVMAALGGCWWPSEVMPEWLRTGAHVFPTAWAMDGFHALISFGRGFEAVVVPCAALIAFGAVFSWIGARKLQTSTL